jgi:hypothetical protein
MEDWESGRLEDWKFGGLTYFHPFIHPSMLPLWSPPNLAHGAIFGELAVAQFVAYGLA